MVGQEQNDPLGILPKDPLGILPNDPVGILPSFKTDVSRMSPFWQKAVEGAVEQSADETGQAPKFLDPTNVGAVTKQDKIDAVLEKAKAVKIAPFMDKFAAGMSGREELNKNEDDLKESLRNTIFTIEPQERLAIVDQIAEVNPDFAESAKDIAMETPFVTEQELEEARQDPELAQRSTGESVEYALRKKAQSGIYPASQYMFKRHTLSQPDIYMSNAPIVAKKLADNFVGGDFEGKDKKQLIQEALNYEEDLSGQITQGITNIPFFLGEVAATGMLVPEVGATQIARLGKVNKLWSRVVNGALKANNEGLKIGVSQGIFSGQVSPEEFRANYALGAAFNRGSAAADKIGTLMFGESLVKGGMSTRLAHATVKLIMDATFGTAIMTGISGDFTKKGIVREGIMNFALGLLNVKMSKKAVVDHIIKKGIEEGKYTEADVEEVHRILMDNLSDEATLELLKKIPERMEKTDLDAVASADMSGEKVLQDVALKEKEGQEIKSKPVETQEQKGGEDVTGETEQTKSSLEQVNEAEIARRAEEQKTSSDDIARDAAKQFAGDKEILDELYRISHESTDPQAKEAAKQILKMVKESKQQADDGASVNAELSIPIHESWFKRATNYTIKQSLGVVRSMGEAGAELAKRIEAVKDFERNFVGKPSEIVFDTKRLSRAELRNFTEIDNAKRFGREEPLPINDNVKKMVETYDKYYESVVPEFVKRKIQVMDESGEMRDFQPMENYRPRKMKFTFDELGIKKKEDGTPVKNKARDLAINMLMKSGRARNEAEAAYLLDNYVGIQRTRKAGNIEFSRMRGFDFPDEFYVTDPAENLIAYAASVGKRLGSIDQFGIKGAKASELLDKILKDGHNEKFARSLFRYETGQLTEPEQRMLTGVNHIKGWQALTKFTPFTTLRNAMQGFLGSSTRGNLKAGMYGLVKAFTKEGQRAAYRSGALVDHIERIVQSDLSGEGRFVGNYMDAIGFTQTDAFNRIISAAAGETFYKDMLGRIKSDSILKRRALREFKKLGLDAEEISKRGEFTEDEINLIRRSFAGDAQFNIRPSDLPLFWSSPQGKLITQWKPFGYKMAQLMRDSVWKELGKGNAAPLATMLLAYGMAGETVTTIIDYIREVAGTSLEGKPDFSGKKTMEKSLLSDWSKKQKDEIALRVVSDVASLGAAGLFVDMIRSFGYGKSGAVSVIAGPTVGEVVQTSENLLGPAGKAMTGDYKNFVPETIKGAVKVAERNAPGAGILRTVGATKSIDAHLKKVLDDIFKEEKSKTKKKSKP